MMLYILQQNGVCRCKSANTYVRLTFIVAATLVAVTRTANM